MFFLMFELSLLFLILFEWLVSGSGVDVFDRFIEFRRDFFIWTLFRDRFDEGRFRFDIGFLVFGVWILRRLVVRIMGVLSLY